MNYNNILKKYINKCPFNEPIFIDEIRNYFINNIKVDNDNKVFKIINVYINRLVKEGIISQFIKGVYYKPIKGVFGPVKLDANKVIKKKYLMDENGLKGYYSGAILFNKVGLTTQVPKNILIITNEYNNNYDYENNKLGIVIRKPKLYITEDNYKYLQLFDLLLNKDNIKIEVDNEEELIYRFIENNDLKMQKIFQLANLTNNKKIINKLYDMGGANE